LIEGGHARREGLTICPDAKDNVLEDNDLLEIQQFEATIICTLNRFY